MLGRVKRVPGWKLLVEKCTNELNESTILLYLAQMEEVLGKVLETPKTRIAGM
jgi:hypothetical protein